LSLTSSLTLSLTLSLSSILSLSLSPSLPVICAGPGRRAGNLVGLFFYQDFTPPGYSPEVPYPIQGTTSR
jgi:hypothetical protein